ncbi:MAG TPA: 4Fe-4S binding protein [candidate division Zixibacteria bacterium]|nr:4Fe-4S binding protein [candidate division Zixibacteria bacterium]
MGVLKDIKNLILGLTITGPYLCRHAVTVQYPEEKRDDIPERSRGVVVLLSDKETGELNCTACELCMRTCPTGAIRIKSHRDENKRKVLDSFVVETALCCYCGMCEEACNFCAIKMATMYEFSTTDINDTVWDMKKLQKYGRNVPYEDTRKKKSAAAEKPAPKPDAGKPAEAKAEEAPKPVEGAKPEAPAASDEKKDETNKGDEQ